MLLPESLAEPIRESNETNTVQAVSLLANSSVVQELAVAESGNSIKCFVPVSPGDKLSVQFHIPGGELEIVDLIVDGILRDTHFNRRSWNTHNGTFTRVCHCERRSYRSMGRIQSCEMVVAERTKQQDVGVGLGNMSETNLASVGTIEVRVYRRIPADRDGTQGASLVQADRGPTFEKYAAWWELKNTIDISGGDPSYQIEFADPTNVKGLIRKRINQEIQGYYLWASFKYVYRSISMLKAMGFTVDEARPGPSIKPEEDQSPYSAGLTHSPSLASHDAASRDENICDEETPVPLAEDPKRGPSSLSYPSTSSQPTSLTDKGKSNISKPAGGKSGARYTHLLMGKKRFFGNDFAIPEDDDYQSSSDMEEDDLSSSFEQGETGHGESNSNPNSVRGRSISRLAALTARRCAQPKVEGAYAIGKPEVGAKKVDKSRNSIPEMNIMPLLLHEVSQRSRGVSGASRNSNQSSHPSQSFCTKTESKSTHIKPTGENDQDDKNRNQAQKLLDSALCGPNDGESTKFTDSPHAEASRYTENPAVKEGVEVQAHLKEDLPAKRKFEHLSTEGLNQTDSSIKREWYSMSDTERNLSKKARREEYARKRQIKQQALDMAKAEAKALQERLDEMEVAAIAKEEAKEEAELEEVDRQIELAIKDSEILKAKIRELENLEAQ